jgi:uncharacterized membrane protein YcjF (UPF0283 family)
LSSSDSLSKSRFHQVLLWLMSLGLILLGIYLSHINFMETEWLSRAGCIIVILGIWSGLRGIIQERLLLGRLRWRHRNAITEARARLHEEEHDDAEIEKEMLEIEHAFQKEHEELSHRLKLSLGVLEVSLLMTGTFLWGFGDLLVR